MSGQISYPQVNGHRFSYASIAARFNDQDYIGFKSINYKTTLKPGVIRGTSPYKLGRTRGNVEHTCSVEIYKEEWDNLKESLGDGFMEKVWSITVAYAEDGSPTIQDDIQDVRITDVDDSHAEGTDGLTVKLELDPMNILYNGVSPLAPLDTQGLAISIG